MSILKKIFFLSLFLFFLSGLFWGVYNLSFKKDEVITSEKKSDQKEASADDKTSDKNIPSAEKISALSAEAVAFPALSSSGDSVVYYLKNGQQALEVDFYGNKKRILPGQLLANLEEALWSPDRRRAVLKTKNSDGGYSFLYRNFENNTDSPIKNNVDEVSWQLNVNRIFYKYYEPKTKTRSLNVSDPDGTNWKKITDLEYRNVSIAQIPKTGLVSFWNSGDAFTPTIFRYIPLIGGEAKTISEGGFGADYLWNGAGEKALVSQSETKGGYKMKLGTVSYSGEYKDIGLPTFVSKCVWSKDEKTIYCALPGEIPDNSVLPNDYKDGKFTTADTFWKINAETGEKTRVVETSDIKDRYDASNLFLDQNESLLFFVNKVDDKLYKITL